MTGSPFICRLSVLLFPYQTLRSRLPPTPPAAGELNLWVSGPFGKMV